jgi:hypothetical protein
MKYTKEEIFDLIEAELQWAKWEGFSEEVARDSFTAVVLFELCITRDDAIELWNNYMDNRDTRYGK